MRPTFLELARQALSSTRRGYDLLAPKFEQSDYVTEAEWITLALMQVEELWPRSAGTPAPGADLACGTGRGARALREYCDLVEGYDFSTGMLEQAERLSQGMDGLHWRQCDLSRLSLEPRHYHRVTTFGAWGHILPGFREEMLATVAAALRPGGVFLTLTGDEPTVCEKRFWYHLLFDLGIRIRNRIWPHEFHMYYRLNNTGALYRLIRRAEWMDDDLELTVRPLKKAGSLPLSLLCLRRRPER